MILLTALKPRHVGHYLPIPARIANCEVPKCLYRPALYKQLHNGSTVDYDQGYH